MTSGLILVSHLRSPATARYHHKSRLDTVKIRRRKTSRAAEPVTGVSELEWFASNPTELELFRNKYVAIYNNAVIGWGDSVSEALRVAKALDIHSDPLVAYIEPSELQVFVHCP